MDLSYLQQHPYYERATNRNGKKIFTFKKGEAWYRLHIDQELDLTWYSNQKANNVEQADGWFQRLYAEFFIRRDQINRVKRLTNGEKTPAIDILYTYTYWFEERNFTRLGKDSFLIEDRKVAEFVMEKLREERYLFKEEKSENNTIITVKGEKA